MSGWDEADHPRDRRGRFIEKADWASIASDRAAGILGPQGEFNSEVIWRAFPSTLAPDLVPGDDPRDAVQQVRRAELEWRGPGRWWWLPGEIDDVGFYGGDEGMVLIGSRVRAGERGLRERPGHSGHYAYEPVDMAVVAMQIWEGPARGGGWRLIPVPPGLVTQTHAPYEDDNG